MDDKSEVPYHSRYGTIKIAPYSKRKSAEHRPTYCSPSPTKMVVSINKISSIRDIKNIQPMYQYR